MVGDQSDRQSAGCEQGLAGATVAALLAAEDQFREFDRVQPEPFFSEESGVVELLDGESLGPAGKDQLADRDLDLGRVGHGGGSGVDARLTVGVGRRSARRRADIG